MAKSLLILTQYFPPEVGAPQNRLFELAIRLKSAGIRVVVLTAMPNYPKGEIHPEYVGKSYFYEEMDGLEVHRSSIYVTKSKGIAKRLRNYFSFVRSSKKIGLSKLDDSFDYLMVESPPLFLAYTAMTLAKKKNAKLIFNVSDLWPESAEKLGLVTNKFFLKRAQNLEEKAYRNSDLITGQTQGIVSNIKGRFPNKEVYWLPNGCDLDYYNPSRWEGATWRSENGFSKEDIIFFYGGIIGHAQGLQLILKGAKQIANPNVKFVLMGAGPVKPELLQLKKDLDISNVVFMDPVTKSDMPSVVSSIDVAVVPLRKLDLFKGAIPSKIFEAQAMEKPILLGVDGEARDLFIKEGQAGVYFEPENVTAFVAGVNELAENTDKRIELGRNGRKFVNAKFNRNVIAEGLIEELKKLD